MQLFQPSVYQSCWITTENKKELEDFLKKKSGAIAYDKEHNPVFLQRANGCSI